MDPSKDDEVVLKQANYLLITKRGLAAASIVSSRKEIEDCTEMTFNKL